ncbi:pentatricopeptide repeat-containing protein At5g61800 [Typha latifolia]|uniref:pentatricopeptide repeat-containing protein At5g61800 n=1 Tax=Typha latifolia TaxID=4733 RepID=UPI003C2FB814
MHHHPLLLLLLNNKKRSFKSLHHLKSIHAKATVLGLLSLHPSSSSISFVTALLHAFTDLRHHLPPPSPATISYPLSLFHQIPSPTTFPYNLVIRAHTLLSFPFQSLLLFSRMRRLAVPPDSHTFPFALKACSAFGSLPLGQTLHSQLLKFGFAGDLFVSNTLLAMYASCASVSDAQQLFDESPIRDVVSSNALIDGYAKAGDLVVARNLFDGMLKRDVVSWGTLLAGYSQAGRFKDALELFERMMESGTRPDDVAIVSMLSCCAQLGALDKGRAIHEYIQQNRVTLNVYLSTGLVDMYAKCGCINVAIEIFESSRHKNLFTWNAIIVGLAMHGHGELSLEYYDRMRVVGVPPDGVTFLGVLVGCSHLGLVETARRLFGEMETVYGVVRELKHYGCMADMLGRAGLIKEAMEMIEGMPMEGDTYVWGGVLGGCRIHGNVEVAEVAVQHLLELNPEDSGIYSIMAGIYATARRWEDVARMRKLMDDRKVRKNVGCSSIEVDQICDVLSAG